MHEESVIFFLLRSI